MHDPAEGAEGDKPQHTGTDEKQNAGQQPALEQLAEAGNEKAAERGNHVACGTLS
jgi:hypothetical protein